MPTGTMSQIRDLKKAFLRVDAQLVALSSEAPANT